jgi:drug/metabolite transporter (DMT)-like permease
VLLWALVLGLVVFGEIPSPLTLVGAVIVVGAGLYTLWREQVVAGRRAAAAASPRPFAPPPRERLRKRR